MFYRDGQIDNEIQFKPWADVIKQDAQDRGAAVIADAKIPKNNSTSASVPPVFGGGGGGLRTMDVRLPGAHRSHSAAASTQRLSNAA
jgi:hypothetical protein